MLCDFHELIQISTHGAIKNKWFFVLYSLFPRVLKPALLSPAPSPLLPSLCFFPSLSVEKTSLFLNPSSCANILGCGGCFPTSGPIWQMMSPNQAVWRDASQGSWGSCEGGSLLLSPLSTSLPREVGVTQTAPSIYLFPVSPGTAGAWKILIPNW